MLKKIVLSIFIIFLLAYGVFAQTAQTITLKPGFNFISFSASISSTPAQLKTQNPVIEDIYLFSASAGSFLSATEGTLSTLAAGKGYIIKSSSASDNVINVPGDAVQTIGNINLKTGFNLIGFSKTPTTTVSFSSLMNVYSTIKGIYKWSPAAGSFIQVIRDNSGAVTLLDGADPSFKTGESYFFNLTEDTTINYDGSNIILGNGPPAPIAKTLELTGTVGASATASPSYSLTRAIDLSTMQISVYDEMNNLDVEGAIINATGTNTFKATLPVATADRYLSVLVKSSDNKVIYKSFLGRVPKATEVTENTVKISNIKVSDESTARAIIVLENRYKIPITAVIAKKSVDTSINNTEFALALEEHIAGLEDRVPELKQAVNLIANVLTTPGVDNAIKEKVTEITFSESSKLLNSYVSLLQDANTLQTINQITVPTQLTIGSKQITAQSSQSYIYETVAGMNDTIGQRAEMPVLDPPPGQYNSAIAVKMTCATPNANIIYDYGDGNQGINYTGPVAINKTCKLNVAAFRSDWPMSWHSKFVNATYTIGSGGSETTETQTLASISLEKTSEIIAVTTEKYNLSNVKITAHYSNGDSKEVQASRWEMVSSPGIFSDMDNSYLPWGKTGDAVFNAVYSENGIDKKAEFKLMVKTQEEIDKNSSTILTLSKTSDEVSINMAYDLSKIIAIIFYSDKTTKEVMVEWNKISGSGTLTNSAYTGNTIETAILTANYSYNGILKTANFKLNVSNKFSTQEVTVIESQMALISFSGGIMHLKSGISFSIPQNSVVNDTNVEIAELNNNIFKATNQTFLKIMSTSELKNGMLEIPVNDDDELAAYSVTQERIIPLIGVYDYVKKNYTIQITTLSSNSSKNITKMISDEDNWRFNIQIVIEKINKNRVTNFTNKFLNKLGTLIKMPYYTQELTNTCWAAATLMLLKAYKNVVPEHCNTIYKICHHMKISVEGGIKRNVFYNNFGKYYLEDFLSAELNNTKVERNSWCTEDACLEYILNKLNEGKPVMLWVGNHFVIIIGLVEINNIFVNSKIIIQNPANIEPYTAINFNKLIDFYLNLDFISSMYPLVTYVVDNKLTENNLCTIHMHPPSSGDSIRFLHDNQLKATCYWNHLSDNGYNFENLEIPEFNKIYVTSMGYNTEHTDMELMVSTELKKVNPDGKLATVLYTNSLIKNFRGHTVTENSTSNKYTQIQDIIPDIKPFIQQNDNNFIVSVNLYDKNGLNKLDGYDVKFIYRKLFINPSNGLKNPLPIGSPIAFVATIGNEKISNDKINWSIAPSDAGAAITAGILSVTPNAAGKLFTIKGVVNDPESIHNGKEAFFEVNNKILKIEAPYDQIQTHWTSYQLFALYGEETVTNEVDWSIEPANGGLSFDSSTKGLLKIEDTVSYGEYIVKIKYASASNPDAVIEAKKPITVIKRTVANPTFSPEGGLCQFPINVTISCQTKDAKIKYTLDDSDPITSNTAITSLSPITVNLVGAGDSSAKSATIKAIAFRQGMADTDICSASYSYIANPDLRIICSIDNYEIRSRLTLFKVFVVGASQTIDSVTLENPSDGAEITKLEPGGDYGYMFTSPSYTGTYSDDAIFYIKATSGTLTGRFKITVIRPKN